jgi:hypothetical protein
MIDDKVRQLLPGIPRSNFYRRTYVREDARVKEEIQGTVVVQYTPYERDSDPQKRSPQARVRLFIEDQSAAIYDKYWANPA